MNEAAYWFQQPNQSNGIEHRRRKMDMRKYAGENYLKVDDVRDGPRRATIALVKVGNYERPELILDGDGILSLNVTNTRLLIKAYGQDGSAWVGREIELRLGSAIYKGVVTDSIIVAPLSAPIDEAERQKAQERAEAADLAELDDDIPF
jgi:hypothetical protein